MLPFAPFPLSPCRTTQYLSSISHAGGLRVRGSTRSDGKVRTALDKTIPEVLARVPERLPAALIDPLRKQWNGLSRLDEQIADIERRMRDWIKEDKAVKAIREIPGARLLKATAAVAMMGDAKTFRSGREFAAWGGRCAEADRKTPQAKAGTGVTKISTQSTACRGVWSIFIDPGETLKNKCTSYAVSIMPGRQSRKS